MLFHNLSWCKYKHPQSFCSSNNSRIITILNIIQIIIKLFWDPMLQSPKTKQYTNSERPLNTVLNGMSSSTPPLGAQGTMLKRRWKTYYNKRGWRTPRKQNQQGNSIGNNKIDTQMSS